MIDLLILLSFIVLFILVAIVVIDFIIRIFKEF